MVLLEALPPQSQQCLTSKVVSIRKERTRASLWQGSEDILTCATTHACEIGGWRVGGSRNGQVSNLLTASLSLDFLASCPEGKASFYQEMHTLN